MKRSAPMLFFAVTRNKEKNELKRKLDEETRAKDEETRRKKVF